jgi:hypothetical protein
MPPSEGSDGANIHPTTPITPRRTRSEMIFQYTQILSRNDFLVDGVTSVIENRVRE